MRQRRYAFVLLWFACASPSWSQPAFIPLGDLPGGDHGSHVRAVSADGAVAVGYSFDAIGQKAFRWTAAGGIAALSSQFGSSRAIDVSANGSVIVGDSCLGGTGCGFEAFRYTDATGIVEINGSIAFGVSADGSVVGVNGYYPPIGGFIWTASGGLQNSGFGPIGYALSGDGTTVVGANLRCVVSEGCATLIPASPNAGALAVSHDGSVVVGYLDSGAGNPNGGAYRWSATDGLVVLDGPLPPTYAFSEALGVSRDGSVIVGDRNHGIGVWPDGSSEEAFVWTATDGMQGVRSIAADRYGLDLTGWILRSATAVSEDGRAIAGDGVNPNGELEAWLFIVPECGDGKDDDGDGLIDFDGGAAANHGTPLAAPDPGCRDGAVGSIEKPTCQDGLDNDGDGKIDFDGGASANGGIALGPIDPQCVDKPWKPRERACGIGGESVSVLALLSCAARRTRAFRSRRDSQASR